MTPFAGVGVNCGMQDALELARRIIKRKDEWTTEEKLKTSVSDATKEYELEMWPRAKANAEKTWEYLGVFFNPIGAEEMVRYFGAIKMAEDKAKEEAKAREEAEAAAKASESQGNGEATSPENTTAEEPQTQKTQPVETEPPQPQEIQLELTKQQEPQQEEPKPQEEAKVEEPQTVQVGEVKPAQIETKVAVATIQEAVPVLVS